ncbi:hypothetical protein FRC03_005511 [Tulasnella sp. 419]|nr:hypothetical protein FRC03_005511 [Tulasnella sp. 419]
MAGKSLLDCPPELIEKILSHLNIGGILLASQLCRYIHTIVKDSVTLRYIIELEVTGLKETTSPDNAPLTSLNTVERLEHLRTREDRWMTANWWRTDQISLLPSCPLYELYGGVFLQMWDYRVAFVEKHTSINVFTLPSSLRGIRSVIKNHSCELGAKDLLELAIDPAQNLFVTIGTCGNDPKTNDIILGAFLRTMDDKPHPAAATSLITFGAGSGSIEHWGQLRIVPQVAGDLLGILVCAVEGASTGMMNVWRWTTGELLLELVPPSPAPSFTFLSEDTLVLPHIMHNPEFHAALHVYRIPSQSSPPGTLKTYPPLVTYELPAMNTGNILGSNLICRSYPLPSPNAYVPPSSISDTAKAEQSTDSNEDSRSDSETSELGQDSWLRPVPFTTDPTNRIVTFSFIFNVLHSDELGHGTIAWQESFVLFTHVATLLEHVPPATSTRPATPQSSNPDSKQAASEEPSISTNVIPWNEWSQRSRWLPDRPRRNWYSHTYGHRFVRPKSSPVHIHRDCFFVQILDFNPLSIRKMRSETEKAETGELPVTKGQSPQQSTANGIAQLFTLPITEEAILSLSEMSLTSSDEDSSTSSTSRYERRLVTDSSTIAGRVFCEPVTTSLPYIEVTSTKPMYEFTGLMMDEEHVLVLKRTGFDLLVDVFSV